MLTTQEEVARLLDAAPSAKYKAALSVAYGAGLRASEVLSLKVSDIDSARMLYAWNRARAVRTALPCSPRCCSIFCASGTASAGRKAGYFQAGTRSTR